MVYFILFFTFLLFAFPYINLLFLIFILHILSASMYLPLSSPYCFAAVSHWLFAVPTLSSLLSSPIGLARALSFPLHSYIHLPQIFCEQLTEHPDVSSKLLWNTGQYPLD
jgi:hypothetical protein